MAGFNAGHDADPSGGEIAGNLLGSALLRISEGALHAINILRMKADRPQLSTTELRAMATVCHGMMKFEDGNVLNPVGEQYVRTFAREVIAYLKSLADEDYRAALKAERESQSKAA
jgi:hypothetical protein